MVYSARITVKSANKYSNILISSPELIEPSFARNRFITLYPCTKYIL